MNKRMTWISLTLAVCLAVCGGAGISLAEESVTMGITPTIVYDGTILRLELTAEALSADVALVESNLLNPALREEPEYQIALATGATIMGVTSGAELQAAGKRLLPDLRVFYGEQDGRVMNKGFIYVLMPDAPRDNLSVKMTAGLIGAEDGPTLDEYEETLPAPEAILAKTVRFPVDVTMGNSRVEEVYVSHSAEAFCVFLRCDGWTMGQGALMLPAGGDAKAAMFVLNESRMLENRDMRWSMYVFDPIGAMPDKIELALTGYDGELFGEFANKLEIDIAGKSAKAL